MKIGTRVRVVSAIFNPELVDAEGVVVPDSQYLRQDSKTTVRLDNCFLSLLESDERNDGHLAVFDSWQLEEVGDHYVIRLGDAEGPFTLEEAERAIREDYPTDRVMAIVHVEKTYYPEAGFVERV